jgi:hypothetical protein
VSRCLLPSLGEAVLFKSTARDFNGNVLDTRFMSRAGHRLG